MHVIGTDHGRDGTLRGVFGHSVILACQEQLHSAAIAGPALKGASSAGSGQFQWR